MMAITTMSSTKVNPRRIRFSMISPFPIWHTVQAGGGRQRIHVEHVAPRRRRVGWAGVAAQAPGGGRRGGCVGEEGVARQATDEIDLRGIRLGLVGHALPQ